MKTKLKPKKPIVCRKHNCSTTLPVCQHLFTDISEGRLFKAIPIFYERYLIEFYFEKNWVCSSCANELNIPLSGVIFFDPLIRKYAILTDEEKDNQEEVDYLLVDPLSYFKKSLKGVCSDCFREAHSEDNLDSMKAIELEVILN